jgi:hypothetical protein
MSVRAMAAALGDVSKSQVDRLFKLGMPRHSVEAARAWRLDNLELSRTADSRIDRPQAPARAPERPAEEPAPPPVAGDDDGPADANTSAYRADRARNERIKADRAEIELRQLQGELVSAREAEQMLFTAGRIVRDRIEMVPARASADLHALLLLQVPEEHRAAVAAGLELHTFERRLAELLREALADATKAIEDARRDDDDEDAA